jgi:hypothetical protein
MMDRATNKVIEEGRKLPLLRSTDDVKGLFAFSMIF